MINANKNIFSDAFLDRKATDEEILQAEERLGIKIPEDYKWFLKTFGHGGYMFEFLGYGLDGSAIFVDETLCQRESGLPDNLMVFQHCDEFFDCLNSDDGSVVTWSPYDDAGIIEVDDDFIMYFYDCVQSAIENT
ncbi:MAG: SMI1/KNR4 family protein [Lachnospiraceae bacterium]|nr:SMI1/KNR4 family protein [Lachnospiraceae bacterium]